MRDELHEEPECADGGRHDWRSPLDVVRGCRENPGVWGHGGGVIVWEVCSRCACYRVTDTWATDPATGVLLDHDLVTYREADQVSRAWAAGAPGA